MGAALAWESETAADPFAAARARFEQLLRVAGSEETQRMQHSDLERLLAEQGQELMRELYQNCVDQQAQAEVTDVVVDAAGKQRTRKRHAAARVGDHLRHGAGAAHRLRGGGARRVCTRWTRS